MSDMSKSGLEPIYSVVAIDQAGREQKVAIAGESPLTILVDDTEVVTLMTLGTHPEELVLGYLRNQGLIEDIEDIVNVKVDWESERAHVFTNSRKGLKYIKEKLSNGSQSSNINKNNMMAITQIQKDIVDILKEDQEHAYTPEGIMNLLIDTYGIQYDEKKIRANCNLLVDGDRLNKQRGRRGRCLYGYFRHWDNQ